MPLEPVLISLYYNFLDVSLIDTYQGLILAEAMLYFPFGVFWMRAFFSSVPRSLLDAARIDGASEFRILRSVLLPPALPAILTLAVLVFVWSWNEFLLPLVLVSGGVVTTAPVNVGLFTGQHLVDIPGQAAAAADSLLAAAGPLRPPPAALHPRRPRRLGEGLTRWPGSDSTGVSKLFGDVDAVDDLSLEAPDGEFLVLVGPSGSGKTTALRAPRRTRGRRPRGASGSATGTSRSLRPQDRDIAMVFQDYALYPQMSVEKNMGFALKNQGMNRQLVKSASTTPPSGSGSGAPRAKAEHSSPAVSASASRSGARSSASRPCS